MGAVYTDKLWHSLVEWLNSDIPDEGIARCDFERLSYEIRPCDVLLVEGRSRVGAVIKNVTQSAWTHAALYIGRLHELDDPQLRADLLKHYAAEPDEQLLVEALLGRGTVVTPLRAYQAEHLRICRPHLERRDAQQVMAFAVRALGTGYDIRQLLDLARFLFPYALVPRRWRSTLFNYKAGESTRTVCSTMIAEAFMSVQYPILPVLRLLENGKVHIYQKNPRLFAPRDFDYSPYFDIIKYPFYGNDLALYRQMPWQPDGMVCDDATHCYLPALTKKPIEGKEIC